MKSTATRAARPALKNLQSWPDDLTVVVVGPFPPPYGGMTLQADQLYTLLKKEKAKVKKIANNQKFTGRSALLERIGILRTALHFISFVVQIRKQASPNSLFHVFSHSFASFFLWTAPVVFICRKRGIPVIINYRGGLADEFLKQWRKAAKRVFQQANAVVVPSGYLEAVFLRYGIATQVIPNIIKDNLGREPTNNSNRSAHIVVNRNFEPIYNVKCALQAFAIIQASIPCAKLILIGEGSQRQELEKYVKTHDFKNVQFTGRLSNAEVLKLLQTANILLNPTTVDNMPISIIEAMAVGLPIVSTNAGGLPYLIENGINGILVDINDHQAMAQETLHLLASSSLRSRLSKNARQFADGFRWQKVWPKWCSLYLSYSNKSGVAA